MYVLQGSRTEVIKQLFGDDAEISHPVRLWWAPPQARGRKELPATLPYVGLDRFAEDTPAYPHGEWSVEFFFDVPPAEQGSSEMSDGRARFLFDEAPQQRLRSGIRFSLFEGPTKVADVQVLD